MKNICIDLGNSSVRVAFFDGKKMMRCEKRPSAQFAELFPLIKNEVVSEHIIVSNVGKDTDDLLYYLGADINVCHLSHRMRLPVTIRYATPETLGNDRLANACAAANLFPGENCLVVDAGTCITYDVICQNEFLGGAISPGLQMRFAALNHFTARLPLVEMQNNVKLTGDSTQASILSGVACGLACEVDAMISEYLAAHNISKVLLTGGDTDYLVGKLKNSIFADSELVLKGLNAILLYQQNEDIT
jgi:type III pantothenate kinase